MKTIDDPNIKVGDTFYYKKGKKIIGPFVALEVLKSSDNTEEHWIDFNDGKSITCVNYYKAFKLQ